MSLSNSCRKSREPPPAAAERDRAGAAATAIGESTAVDVETAVGSAAAVGSATAVGESIAVDWGVTAIGGDAKGGRGAGISEKRERGAAEAKTV